KTSGTTSGVKYIPMTRESTPFHVKSARDCLLNYFTETKNGSYFDGKMVYLSGSPLLTNDYGIKTGRLSGIVNHQIPRWLQSNKLPTYSANIIENWEEKVEAIVDETMNEDVRLVGGIPPWVQMYYERLLDRSGCSHVIDVFPNLSVFVYGGVNYEPYRSKLEDLVGAKVDTVETYPASEGFFAFQDKYPSLGLLLNVDAGMYFEFIPADEIFHDQPTRLSLEQVEIGVNYALLVSSNAGLWAYNIGDTVEFISLDPPRITVTGRIKHFISAFGEHVIGKEVEEAVRLASHAMHLQIIEFTVAPQVNPEVGLPYHEWLIEFNEVPADIARMEDMLDKSIQDQNIYYKDLIRGKVLRKAKITPVARNAFRKYMESIGKLGGQNKVARLSNDRSIANALEILHER
ncbi:MAG: GH3 auxin-responsive promoter family protein, partial [Saprospiraceae bacterium]|nr:GH3 auxin-responsive promoter family protein [Saprospiraceae bacterium]